MVIKYRVMFLGIIYSKINFVTIVKVLLLI